MTRIYIDHELTEGDEFTLPGASAHHVSTVLRLSADAEVTLFNGRGGVFSGRLTRVSRREGVVVIGNDLQADSESPLAVTLVQSISRGERMDYTIQKAVELGVHEIVPVVSKRTVVQLDQKRVSKRIDHWRGIIQHAAEQSGRTALPHLASVQPLAEWVAARPGTPCYVLHPTSSAPLARQPAPAESVTVVAGPEGGFEDNEIAMLERAGAVTVALGPRVLRTETAAVCALSVMQALWGDLA